MEFVLRDTRHLKGTTPTVHVAAPQDEGLAVGSGLDQGRPYLDVRDAEGTLRRIDLGAHLNIEVLEERRCTGRWTDEGWTACPHEALADRFDQCPACHPLPDRDCVFNPRCHECLESFCQSPHKLYLAFYGELPKIGMTRSQRGDARLVEQGADAFAIIAHAGDRAAARRLEDLVTRRLQVPQSRRADELLPRTAREVPWTAIENAYKALVPRLGEVLGSAPGPLERVTEQFGEYPLPIVPTLAGVQGHHAGDVLGMKGRYLFYRAPSRDGTPDRLAPIWALNLSAVVTHRVRFEASQAPPLS